MGHTYASVRVHTIFSTKERRKLIPAELQPALWAYMGGIANNLNAKVFAIGGVDDHSHLVLGVPPTLKISELIQKIKANSSRWAGQQIKDFGWQEGYGVFSVSISHMDAAIRYVQNQPAHHKRISFEEECREILRKHGMTEVPSG